VFLVLVWYRKDLGGRNTNKKLPCSRIDVDRAVRSAEELGFRWYGTPLLDGHKHIKSDMSDRFVCGRNRGDLSKTESKERPFISLSFVRSMSNFLVG
jgi:hypothetical protein